MNDVPPAARTPRVLTALSTLLFVASPSAALAGADAAVEKRLRPAIRDLPVAPETRAGYDRSKFKHWIDADGDCEDTRAEVLRQESQVEVSRNEHCTITGGRWFSWYDGVTVTDPSALDVDHMVPLAEAWDSGARRWSAGTRKRLANDLRDRRTLAAVSASSNRSKGDRDPADWLPPRARCKYVKHYVAVKIRWSLTVDRPERRALRRRAEKCPNAVLRVRRARVVLANRV